VPSPAEVREARKRVPSKATPRRRTKKPEQLEPPTLELWPSLGGWACDWIEAYCVHGPGPVRGQPAKLTDEERKFLWNGYEVAPKGHPREGRRRWSRAAYVRRKGVRKTEFSDWITCFELLGPCRFDGWDADGNPVGRPIVSPFIPVAATSLEQSEDTLWGAIYATVTEGPICDEFALDIGLDRIIELRSGGEMKPVTASSIARDGGRPTFSPRDEIHLWFAAELVRLNDALLRNLTKRPHDQPWALGTTTAWAPGQGSVAEAESKEAELAAVGQLPADTILWDHRRAADHWNLDDDDELEQAIIEASGDALPWTDVELNRREFRRGARSDGKRYYLSIPASATSDESWLKDDPKAFEECREPDLKELDRNGGPVTVGVDSALRSDSIAVVAGQERADGTVAAVARVWVAGSGTYDRAEVRNHLRKLVQDLAGEDGASLVRAIGYDPAFFDEDAKMLVDEGLPMIEVPQSHERMVPACLEAFRRIVDRTLRHDFDEVASSQVTAAVPRETDRGWRLSKGKSGAKIDCSVALAIEEYVRVFVPVVDQRGPNLW